MRNSFVIVILSLIVSTAGAREVPASLEEARAAYEAGDFAQAAVAYESAIAAGADHALVHYNLGNAHFKAGDLGEAIASYVRAQRRAPRNDAIRANLAVARAQIRDRELAHGVPAVLAPIAWVYGSLSLDEWWVLFAVAFAVAAVVSIAGHWRADVRPIGRRVLVGAVAVASLALVMGGVRYRVEVARASAVVVQEEIEVRSGPGRDYNLAFRVHEGLQVQVAERRGDWWRIDLGGELVGWVPASSLETL